MDTRVAKGLGLALHTINPIPIMAHTINPIPIMVADRRKIQSTRVVKRFDWLMQGHQFKADFYIIPLKGSEVVLGVKWRAQLGDVTRNFRTLSMKFGWSGGVATLQGVDDKENVELLSLEDPKDPISADVSMLCPNTNGRAWWLFPTDQRNREGKSRAVRRFRGVC